MPSSPLAEYLETKERLISLNVNVSHIEDVLQEVSRETGYTFIYDRVWSSQLVSIILENVSLQTCLRNIFSKWNNALIYLPDKKIKIVILDSAPLADEGLTGKNNNRFQPLLPSAQVARELPTAFDPVPYPIPPPRALNRDKAQRPK